MPLAMHHILPLLAVVLLAGSVQGLTGFGSLLIATPLLSLFLPIKTIIPLGALLALVINCSLLIQLRRQVSWGTLAPLLAATLPGIAVGVWVLKAVPAWVLAGILGLTCVFFSLHSLLHAATARAGHSRVWAWLAGFLAGCLGGSIGANGPPIIIYAAAQSWNPRRTKALMAGYFFTAGVGISGLHAATGLITPDVLRLFVTALPALILGIGLGMFAFSRLGERGYRRYVLLLVLLLGVVLLMRGALDALG